MAWSVTTLAWGLIEFKDGYLAAGELGAMYDSIKWPLDYFIKCHMSPNVLYGQVNVYLFSPWLILFDQCSVASLLVVLQRLGTETSV